MRLIRGKVINALGIESEVVNFGNANIISGGNATGKTSWVDIIDKGLYITDRREKIVRTGAEKAFIELETDDGMKVSRTVDTDGRTVDLKVTRDGIPVRSPQTFLDQLFGVTKERKDVFAFNPVDFMGKSAKEQAKILLSLMPITVTQQDMLAWFGKIPPVNPNMHGLLVLKELEKYWYDARREANGAVKEATNEVAAVIAQLPDNYDVTAWENFSTMDLSDEIRDGEKVNNFRIQAQELIDGSEIAKLTINNKYDLQVKEQGELLEFKVGKAKQGIKTQKNEIKSEILQYETQIETHKNEIDELIKQINNEKAAIVEIEGLIKLKEKDLDNFDNSILTTKTESLTNEMNIAVKGINENRQREIATADDRVVKAEKYLTENPVIEIVPLEEKYSEAEKMKGFVEMAHNLKNVQDRLEKDIEIAETYDKFVELCRAKPTEILRSMKLPVDGITIYFNVDNDEDKNNGTLLFDGLTLKNLNTAQQISKCIEIAKAYADGTVLKLINCDRMESLDRDSKVGFYREIRANKDYQFIVTTVTNGQRQMDIIDVEYLDDESFEKWLETVN